MRQAAVEVRVSYDGSGVLPFFEIHRRDGPCPGRIAVHTADTGRLNEVVLSEQQRVTIKFAASLLA